MTVVELVLVITIITILAAVAGPRFFDQQVFDERGYADELAAALRYARQVAVASGCPVRVVVSAGGYDLTQQAALGNHCNPADGGFATPVRFPDGTAAAGSAPSGVSVSPALTLTFDGAGITSLGADQTLNVGGRALLIDAGSGLVSTS